MGQLPAPSPSSMGEKSGSEADLKRYACLSCRERKVRCDRHNPCFKCVRAARECSFIAPVRGKRQRTKVPKEGLHARLRRYEELLKSYGAKIEQTEYDGDSDLETMSQPDVEMAEDTDFQSKTGSGASAPDEKIRRLVAEEQSSRRFDSTLWSNLGKEFPYPEEDSITGPNEDANVNESDLFMGSFEQPGTGPGTPSTTEALQSLHPPYHILLKLWDIFVDRVDPLMKILHLPTFWSSLNHVRQYPQDISEGLEALISAFYLVVVSILDEAECLSLLGAQKSVMFGRHERAARQALKSAGFLHTSSLKVLQAYAIYLMGTRNFHRKGTMFILSGVALRLARKMELHQDGSALALSPFEAEMRRRLWWHVFLTDYRISDLLNTKPSMDLFCGNAKMPLNVMDEDLSPDMVDLPPERTGITSAVVCLIRCEVGAFLRKFSSPSPDNVSWDTLTNPNISLPKTESMIKELEDIMERKYLRYCDPVNTLHQLVLIMIRTSICKIRLYAHNPRRFANSGVKTPQAERDIIFTSATKLLEYVNLIRGNPNFDKYMWQIGTTFLWNSLLYVLIEARYRKVGPEVDRLWQLVGVVLPKYPKIFERRPGAMYTALGNCTLEAWDDCVAATKDRGLPEPLTPEFISAIRRCRAPSAEPASDLGDPMDLRPVNGKAAGSVNVQPRINDSDPLFNPEPLTSSDFPSLFSFEMAPDDWVQWDNLVNGEGLAQADVM